MKSLFKIYMLLGSNMGDRRGIIIRAGRLLIDRLLPGPSEMMDISCPEIIETVGSFDASRKKEEPFCFSGIEETEPWGKFETKAEKFMNQAVMCITAKEPEEALSVCLEIEKELGRVRREKSIGKKIEKKAESEERIYASRVIDIDILKIFVAERSEESLRESLDRGDVVWSEIAVNEENLQVPHPRLGERPFAMKLLKEIL